MSSINRQRRDFLSLLGSLMVSGLSAKAAASALLTASVGRGDALIQGQMGRSAKAIPSSGELLPVIGMGTWRTFNVGNNPRLLKSRTQVLQAFYEHGGGMIDSSPMYGSAEAVLGHAIGQLGERDKIFAATKVWTHSTKQGISQIKDSEELWGIKRFDLFQVHNLLNWEEHLQTLLKYKAGGQIRYVGITTSHGRRHSELAEIMKTQPIDFVQLTYNILDRDAEQLLLPLAHERGIAVIANRPFQGGSLMRRYQRYNLPAWAADIDCQNWAQFFLKFVTSHPAVTCAIPATSQVVHMHENMGALKGVVPNSAFRKQMVGYLNSLT